MGIEGGDPAPGLGADGGGRERWRYGGKEDWVAELERGWLGLISRQTNWEEKGPHMLRLTSQPAGEKGGGGCVIVGFLKSRKQNSRDP